jgi:hypothetical protein
MNRGKSLNSQSRLTFGSTGAAEADFSWLLPVFGGNSVTQAVKFFVAKAGDFVFSSYTNHQFNRLLTT